MKKKESIDLNIGSSGFVSSDTYTISPQNTTIGGYDITGGDGKTNSIMLLMTKKPKWHHRFFCRVFLGWNWIDLK
ncbi:MAG: hypothetical protein KatS3mg035_1139 [Bacteroidia bacterium]|nr:MAG: hypothetical protein KatS3mg035_1139 [Bacteroidia bacterium]